MRLSNRGPSRTEFLRDASELLLRGSGTDALVAWLEDGERTFLWRADGRHDQAFGFEELPRCPAGKTLEELVLERIDPGGALGLRTARRACGGLLVEDLHTLASGRPWSPANRLAVGAGCASLLLLPFEIDEQSRGLLQLEGERPGQLARADVEAMQSLAQLFGVAISNRRSQAARAERVKELSCMYRIEQIGAEQDLSQELMLQRIVELLPPAWQYPDLAAARIVADGSEYLSRDFAEGPHHMTAEIRVRGESAGRVDVFYVDRSGRLDRPPLLEGAPFLPEEHFLIDGVARALGSIIERKRAEVERARLEEQVRHADRLATIGQLAAGVAHELNEPLANILGFAQLALRSSGLPAQATEDVRAIVTASLYAREIIKKLMFFARQAPSHKSAVDLSRIVEDGMAFLTPRCTAAGLSVSASLARDLPQVHGDPAQLQQVLVNLVVNAIQAMPNGGELRISTEAQPGSVCLVVEDTGPGVPEQNLDKLFEPFFTTKEVGEGTGLGLAVVHGIVTAHGGTVGVRSRIGQGTRFTVVLPALDGAGSQGAEP